MQLAPSPLTFILNAHSGNTAPDKVEEIIRKELRGRDVRILRAESGQGLRANLDSAMQSGGVIVAGGGDGTVNAVASRLAGTDLTMGVLPLGTLNHFAKDLKIPSDMASAIRVLNDGRTVQVDVAQVNGRTFVNNSSLGVYPQIVRQREREQQRGSAKWTAFAKAAFDVVRKHPFTRVRVHVNGQEVWRRAALVFVGNNLYRLEGLEAGTRERVDGGQLCLYITPHQSRSALVKLALGAWMGSADSFRELEMQAAKEITIEMHRHNVQVAIDGEVVQMETPLRYRILPGALSVIVPEKAVSD